MANLSNLLTGQSNLVTDQDLAAVATTGSYSDLTNKPTIPTGSYTDLTNKPTLATVATSGSYADLSGKPTLAAVATSGSYADLSNKPTVISLKGTSVTYPGDDLAADPAGSQTITITGTGFESTPTVYIGGTIAPSVTFVSATQITVTTPAKAAGTYDVYIVNPGGATAIMVMGISYSGTPTWTTAAGSLGTQGDNFTIQLQATSDSSIVYTLASGSTLPSGVTLNSSGLISGTGIATEQTFNFSVVATDAQNQETSRSFQVSIFLSEAYFNHVQLLLQANSVNAGQNNTFVDSSANNFTLTRNGNASQGSFSPFGTRWSTYFGSANFFYSASNTAFSPGTSDFTIEAWVNPRSYGTLSYIFGVTITNGLVFYVNSGNLIVRTYGGTDLLYSSTIPTLNTWTHVAATRSGTTLRIFVNGVQTASTTNSTNFPQGAAYAGNDSTNQAPWDGYISNLRLVKGTAVYTSNFTPSTTPLTAISGTSWLVCQSNCFVDNSNNAFAITKSGSPKIQRFSPFGGSAYSTSIIGGSAYFDGNGDYVSLPTNTAFSFGTGDFTISTWIYTGIDSLSGAGYSRSLFTLGNVMGYLRISAYHGGTTGAFRAMIDENIVCDGSTVKLSDNAWHNITIVRESGNVRHWIDGTYVGTVAYTTNITNTITNGIGADTRGPDGNWNGYITGTFVNKGTALFTGTANITVPTNPPTAASGNSLVCNFSNAAIYDNAMMHDFETVGNAQVSTTVVKYGTGSMYFDGDGDYIVSPLRLNFGLTFCIEFWMYRTSASANQWLVCSKQGYNANPDRGFLIGYYGNSISIAGEGLGAYWFTGNQSAASNAWHHVAVVGTGSGCALYLNGSNIGYTAWPNAYTGFVMDGVLIGAGADSSLTVGTPFGGYIDDLRITNGLQRYVSNFTPPTTAFKVS